mmetsp:Transcript_6557/g.16279  ORF Transcript_6557/g.16279 Transcript_6557/m.16279 type:complete len:163 (+) Transcript_6557:2774-3262(+)
MEDSTATSLMPSSTEVSRGNIPGRARARPMSAVDRLRLHPSSAKADSVAKRRPTSAQQRSSFQHRGRRLHTTNTGAGTPRSHLISPKYVGMLMLISTLHFPPHYPIQPRLAVCLLKLCSRIHPSSVLPLPMMCQSPPSPALSMSPLPFLSPHEELNVLTHLR